MNQYVQERELTVREVDDEALIVNRITNSFVRLNPIGTAIFRGLAEPASVEELLAGLRSEIETDGVDDEQIESDLRGFVSELSDLRLIRSDSEPAAPRGRLDLAAWRDEMDAAGSDLLTPVWAKIEVSTRCHLDCAHCYIPFSERHPRGPLRVVHEAREMTGLEIRGALDQLAALGTLLVTFTGGEIFVRPDIFDLLEHADDGGFILELFTSATPLTPQKIDRLAALKIGRVQVSVYSHEPETHDAITRSKGSWNRSIAAVRGMVDRGLAVDLACTLMRPNFRHAHALADFARSLGATVSYGYPITARTDGNRDTHELRLTGAELEEVVREMPEYFALSPIKASDERICSAGINMCSITASGELLPCSQFYLPLGNLREQRLADLWRDSPAVRELRSRRMGDLKPSPLGVLSRYDGLCPGLNLLEEGDYLVPARITAETTLAAERLLGGADGTPSG